MLSASDQYRSKVMEQVRISTERLSRVRNGISLSGALDQQGSEVKQRFIESRRISNNILPEIYERSISQQKIAGHEETAELSEVLELVTSVKANQDVIVSTKPAFRLSPELQQKLSKIELDETKSSTLELLLKQRPNFTQSKSVPRLRGLSLEDNYKKGPSTDELNKEVMTRIWREEHEDAISKLNQLQAQQKLQAITDLEASEKRKGKNDSLTKSQDDLGQSQISAMIVKSSFKSQTPGLDKRASELDGNRSEYDYRKKKSGSRLSSSVLKFRRELTPEALQPNIKRIAQNLKTFKLGQVAEVITIPKEKGSKKGNKIEYLNNSPKRVQIKFVPSSETHRELTQRERETREITSLMNRSVAVGMLKTKNSVDYSMGVMRENMKFLEKERDFTQQKLTGRSKDDYSGNITDLRTLDDNKLLYRKWPLASNSHSLNDSVQGSDYVERQQVSYGPRDSQTSLGETTFLIKKYENYSSGRNERAPTPGERNKVEIIGYPIEIVSNVSHNMSSLSRGVTSINSSQNELKPKFQRSVSQI